MEASRAAVLPVTARAAAGAGLLAAGIAVFCWLGALHDARPLPSGHDPLLGLLPRPDVEFLLSWVWIGFHPAVWACWARRERSRLPYFFGMIGFWMIVRSLFIALNPVGPPAGIERIYEGGALSFLQGRFIFDNELFFSGHAGAPYLYSLLSRERPVLARACLAFSVLMGAGVLLSRNHYFIDVAAAYFMTYSIHALGRRWLKGLDHA